MIQRIVFNGICIIIIISMLIGCGGKGGRLTNEQEVYCGKWETYSGDYICINADGSAQGTIHNTNFMAAHVFISNTTLIVTEMGTKKQYCITKQPTEQYGEWTMKLDSMKFYKRIDY